MFYFKLTILILIVNYSEGNNSSFLEFKPVEILLEKCSLKPYFKSPNILESDQRMPTNVTLFVNRIFDLDPLTDTLSFGGTLIVNWTVPCVEKLYQNSEWPRQLYQLKLDVNDVWTPDILHRTGYNEVTLNYRSEKALALLVSSGTFIISYGGIFHVVCDFDYKYFPFDTQVCKMTIQVLIEDIQAIDPDFIYDQSTVIGLNSNWDLLRTEANATAQGSLGLPEFNFYFTFQRRPYYYVITLLCSAAAIQTLMGVALLLPLDSTDRTAYAATVQLAYFMFQNEFYKAMPQSSNPVFLHVYIVGMLLSGTTITFISALLCFLAHLKPHLLTKKITICRKNYRLLYFVDFCFFITFTAITILLTQIPLFMTLFNS